MDSGSSAQMASKGKLNPNSQVNGSSSTIKQSSGEPFSVLFVCLGNICRSPMAEAVFRSLTKAHNNIAKIDSAGTGAYHVGDPPDPRTIRTLEHNDILDYNHAARKVQSSDFTTFDYILAMDKDNLLDLQAMRNRLIKKDSRLKSEMGTLMLFGDFGGQMREEVVDPYYGTRNGFEIAYEQMVRFSQRFIAQVLDSDTKEAGGGD
ncbi:MAG: hypothetical protein Q9217_005778 [Psora testacea]